MQLIRRLQLGLLVCGAVTLLVLVARTYEPPFVAPVAEMATSVATTPRLSEHCQGGGGSTYSPPTCFWTLELDDGTRLGWPWPDPNGRIGRVQRYLRENGPIQVRFWRGTVYQIVVRGGHTYLDYGDAAASERSRQWFWIVAGLVVLACSTVRIVLEVSRVRRGIMTDKQDALARCLDLACAGGGLLLLAARGERIWWSVIALAAFSLAADVVGRRLPLQWTSTCEPAHPHPDW